MTGATPKLSPQIQALVEEQGLQRAATLFPELIAAAAAKGLTLLATPVPPLTIPATAFHSRSKDKAL